MSGTAHFALAFLATAVPAAAFPAFVLRCHDGDTCTLRDGQRIRIAEIDAPEIDQPYGVQARDKMCEMVCGKTVDVEPRGHSYNRLIGLIRVSGLDTSEAMVARGAAWDYTRYDHDTFMPVLQAVARQQGRGLWADPQATPPWEWRRAHLQSWMTKSGW